MRPPNWSISWSVAAAVGVTVSILACSGSDSGGARGDGGAGSGGQSATGGTASGGTGGRASGGTGGRAAGGSNGGGGSGSGGASDGGGGSGGTSSDGGASAGGSNSGGASTGGAAGAGSGGAAGTPCPVDPPAAGATCTAGSCFYERCATFGRVSAECDSGHWTVQSGPCADLECGFAPCPAGQACVTREGGARISECAANRCDGLASCDCIDGCFAGCTLTGTTAEGVAVTCNTCPSGPCP